MTTATQGSMIIRPECSKERKAQLRRKLREYMQQLEEFSSLFLTLLIEGPYTDLAYRISVLDHFLSTGEVEMWDPSLDLGEADSIYREAHNKACHVVLDYIERGETDVPGETGLPPVPGILGRLFG